MNSDIIISVEKLSKKYKLGEIGVNSLRETAEWFWHRLRGRDPAEHMGIVGKTPIERRGDTAIRRNGDRETGRQGDKKNGGHGDGESEISGDTVTRRRGDQETELLEKSNNATPDNKQLITNNDRTCNSDLWALRDISFEVKRGEVLGIIGRNGAGKSTLLKILSRITEPTSGRAVMRGRVGSLLEVGTGFHPELTGRENIFLNGAILGMRKKEIESKFDEIVAFAEVEKFIDTPVKRYSSGMYVRLAFAVAAHLDPEILIVDEVLAVGDAAFQKKCLGKMRDVSSKDGRTVLFVSHNMSVISKLCGLSLWIDNGSMLRHGNTREIVSEYLLRDVSETGSMVWEDGTANPGVTEIKINSLRVFQKSDHNCSALDAKDPFYVEIGYRIFEPLPYARIGFLISNVDGLVVFATYDSDEEQFAGRRTPGEYIITCEVPSNLLSPNQYIISLTAGIPQVKPLIMLENVMVLTVENTEGVGGHMPGHREGIISPKLKWSGVKIKH
ncbi:MAG: ABC transporter ATP-binding protein [Kiritimatiellae bacterium]|nr:ABC transporter ATP-binding protein [Kiritimatiellia bacterium]MDD5521919.1 ABC transporter ATP-binding protein [Kiritimatiellia bacterium]